PWEARDSIGQIAPVREDEPAREEVRPTISNLDHQPALLDHVIGKALPLEILLQRIRSYGREAYLMLLDRFESKPPLIFAEIDVFLRDLLAVNPHGDTKQLFEIVSLLLEMLPLLELCRIERGQRDASTSGEQLESLHEGHATFAHHPTEDVTAVAAMEA